MGEKKENFAFEPFDRLDDRSQQTELLTGTQTSENRAVSTVVRAVVAYRPMEADSSPHNMSARARRRIPEPL